MMAFENQTFTLAFMKNVQLQSEKKQRYDEI